MSDNTSHTQVSKFPILNNSTDWRLWSTEILAKVIDRSYDAYAIIMGEYAIPPLEALQSPPPGADGTTPPPAISEDIKQFKRADGVARSYLFQGLAPQHKNIISSAIHSHQAWQLLHQRFGVPTAYDVVIMRRKLLAMKQGALSGEDYITAVQSKVQDLTDASIIVDQITICDVIIQGLNPKYQNAVNSLQHTLATTSITDENILDSFVKVALSLITQHDATVSIANNASDLGNNNNLALSAKGSNKPCSICGKDNHPAINCFFNESGPRYKGTPWRGNSNNHAMITNSEYIAS